MAIFHTDGMPTPVPPAPPKRTISPTLRRHLDYIDAVLAKGDQDAKDLWKVLTATRGHDNNNVAGDKFRYTMPIRAAAFPLTQKAGWRAHQTMGASFSASGTPITKRLDDQAGHFRVHALDAAFALALEVKEEK